MASGYRFVQIDAKCRVGADSGYSAPQPTLVANQVWSVTEGIRQWWVSGMVPLYGGASGFGYIPLGQIDWQSPSVNYYVPTAMAHVSVLLDNSWTDSSPPSGYNVLQCGQVHISIAIAGQAFTAPDPWSNDNAYATAPAGTPLWYAPAYWWECDYTGTGIKGKGTLYPPYSRQDAYAVNGSDQLVGIYGQKTLLYPVGNLYDAAPATPTSLDASGPPGKAECYWRFVENPWLPAGY